MSLLTFIVPVYQPKVTQFEKCLKSLVEQSLVDWDVILVLDGPSSEARDVIRQYANKLKDKSTIIEIEHGGACRARNEGAKYAKGDFWVFWDADCAIEPDTAKGWIDTFKENPQCGFVYSGYKWFDDSVPGYPSESFDPWLLRVNNYISTCFPFRKELFPGWNEDLKSLQDWDFWLKIVEKGAEGIHLRGYGWSTALPTPESISGKGCTPEVWLERMDAVKKLHNIPDKDICVSAIGPRHEGIRLAKLIGADYRDVPNDKPHRYKTIIQIGFTFRQPGVSTQLQIMADPAKHVLFWDKQSVAEAFGTVSRRALIEFSDKLNGKVRQFCEDKEAERILTLCGFNVEVLPMPFEAPEKVSDLPKKTKVLVDASPRFFQVINQVEKAMPEVVFDGAMGVQKIEDYTIMLHYHMERTMTPSLRRAILNGRYVLSNVQYPGAGFLNDQQMPDLFVPQMVEKIREIAKKGINAKWREYYAKETSKDRLLEAIR